MPILRSPAVYVPDLKFGRPISLGSVYVLQSGLSIPSDTAAIAPSMLEDVFYNDEGGDQIQVSQPLATTKGGVLYSGQPDVVRQFYTDAPSYIVAVYSASGALQYYDTMSSTFGGGGGGSAGAASIINDWNLAITPGFYQDASTASLNQPVGGRRFIGWVANSNESGDSLVQVVADVTQANGPVYVRVKSLGIFGAWRQQWDAASFGRQSSPLDATAGAALLVGAGGLVGNAVAWGVSLNDVTLTAFYKVTGSTSDTPVGAAVLDSTVIHVNADSVTAYQIYIEAGNGNLWTRRKSGTWSAWRRSGATGLINGSGNRQITAGSFGSTERFSGGATATLTLVAGVGYDGGIVQVINRNSGALTIAASGVTLTWLQGGSVATGSRTLQTGASCTLIRITSTQYELAGFGIA
jgi:hypothetical protein